MKTYKKPEINITVFENNDIITNSSGGGLTARFKKITDGKTTNSVQLQ